MSRNVYSEIFIHLVWRTKDNLPLITEKIEKPLYDYLQHRCAQTQGVFFHAINGTQDHIHLCVSVPPTLLISDWIGELKGASAYYLNHKIRPKALQWQTGYGVISFGKNNLKFVKDYVLNQKTHHTVGNTHRRLEIIESEAEDKD